MKKNKDLTGNVYGFLTVLVKKDKKLWECLCECGNKKIVNYDCLKRGYTKSCGCFKISKNNKKLYLEKTKKRLLKHSEMKGECRIWNAKSKSVFGYGHIIFYGKRVSAHRVSWMVWKGEIPKGAFVLHSCDVPECINPDHLFLGNAKSNYDDMENKKRNFIPRGEKQGLSKMNIESVIECRYLFDNKIMSIYKLCKKFNVTEGCIRPIVFRKTWKHI